jgi:large subunit ribosomal protein L15
MPLHRRLPKRGFTNIFKKRYAILNVGRLEQLEGDTFTPESLLASGAVSKLRDGLKILAGGELTRKISVQAHFFTPEAEKKITAAGGTIEKIAPKPKPLLNENNQLVAKPRAAKK